MPKFENKPIDVSSGQINLTDEGTITSLQIAALAESTARESSVPPAEIFGQDATGGSGSSDPHVLIASGVKTSGPFLSRNDNNRTTFTNLYNENPEIFNNKSINGVSVSNLETFLHATIGDPLIDEISKVCLYVPDATDTRNAGKWVYSQAIPRSTSRTTDKWFIPEGLMLDICGVTSLDQIVYTGMMDNAALLEPYLGTGNTIRPVDLRHLRTRVKYIAGDGTADNPSQFNPSDPNSWWSSLIEFLSVFASRQTAGISPDTACASAGIDQAVGYGLSTITNTKYETPLVLTDGDNNPLVVPGTEITQEDLSSGNQIIKSFNYNSTTFTNIVEQLFGTDTQNASLLNGKTLDVEILTSQVSFGTTTGGPASINTYSDFRSEDLDAEGNPIQNQYSEYNEQAVIPAINRVHIKTNLARDEAVAINQFLTNQVIGNVRVSNPNTALAQQDIASLTQRNYNPSANVALDRLNLIPVLSGDRIFETVFETDEEGAIQYDDLGVPKIFTITLDQRAALSVDARRRLGMPHPDSELPQTSLIEATYTVWRHISADYTNTYGVSAMTDPELQPDELIDPLSDMSFINIFNSLYTDLSGLSADLSTHKFAISGDADMLIESLSGNSIYTNLNNIYTGLSALSADGGFDVACCDVLQLSAAELSAQTTTLFNDLSALSAHVMDLDLTGGGTAELPCDNLCEDIKGIKDTIITEDHPGGFDIPFPSLDETGDPRVFEPDTRVPTEGAPTGVEPGSVVYTTIVDEKEYIVYKKPDGGWVADGPFDETTPRHYNGPGQVITGGTDTSPTGGTLPEPWNFPAISDRPHPFPEWRDRLVTIRETQDKVDDLEKCCTEFREFLDGYVDDSPPSGYEVPDFTPSAEDSPTGSDTPWYHSVPGADPTDPNNPNPPIILPVDEPKGAIAVPGPESDDPKVYTPVAPDDPNRPDDGGVAPGTVIYKYITQEGETKYIYKHITTNKWIKGDNPNDPNDPTSTPLGDPPDNTGGTIVKRDDGGVDVPYPPIGPIKTYTPVPDDDPAKPNNVCEGSTVYKYVDPATNTTHYVYCDLQTGGWVVGGNPDNPDAPEIPLKPPAGDTTVINSLSALVDQNIINITSLSGCCIDNTAALSALSAAVYGTGDQPDVFVDELTGSIIYNINALYEMVLGGGSGSETDSLQVTINKNNISSLSADIASLSGCCETNRFNITQVNDTLTNQITAIETTIQNLDGDFVNRTEHQTISGEKVFEDEFTVAATADFSENVTIGVGETIFKACTLTNGLTQIQIPRLPEEGVDNLEDLPIDSLYVTDINGTKVLAIKTS